MEPGSPSLEPAPRRRPRLTALVVALSLLAAAASFVVPPHAPLDKADRIGYAICHQIPERSYALSGRPMPLCARCTGTFLGALLGLAAMILRRRTRASRLPPALVLGVLVGFMGFWALDGLNSYLTLFPDAPHLYQPQNWLRLSTGILNGLALITFIFPIANFTLWREPTPEPVIRNAGELLALLPVAALLVVAIQVEIGFLLYPLALISSLGVIVLLSLINSLIAAVVLGREAYARSWREAWVPLVVGVALSIGQIVALGLLRDYLTRAIGIPF